MYDYALEFSAITEKEYEELVYFGVSQVKKLFEEKEQEIRLSTIAFITEEFQKRMKEQGYNINVKKIESEGQLILVRKEFVQLTRGALIERYYWKYRIKPKIYFESDKPITESPIPTWLIFLVYKLIESLPWIILAVFVGMGLYLGIKAWFEGAWLKEEIKVYQDGKLVEQITQPTLVGGLNLAIVAVAVLVVLWLLFGRKRR